MSRTRVLTLLGLAALGLIVLYRWYGSPEREIQRHITEIAKIVAKAPAEDNLTALGKARSLTDHFAENFEFVAEPFDFTTRDRQRLAAAVHQYRSRSQVIAVEIRDRELSVSQEQGRATSHLTVEFLTRFQDVAGREAYRFQLNWVEQNGEWLIDYVNLLEVLPNT